MLYETLDLPFGDHSVEEVETAILPLHRTVDVQRITQPIVGGASEERLICSTWIQVSVQVAKLLEAKVCYDYVGLEGGWGICNLH